MDKKITEKLEEASRSEGYFVTITRLNGGKLTHYQTQRRFPKVDVLPSLEEIKNLIIKGMD